jgi:hypothetical protein
MLRQCRKCTAAVAIGVACTLCGEFVAATEAASRVNLYIAADASSDQPHDHREPKAPISTAPLVIRQATAVASLAFHHPSYSTTPFRWRDLSDADNYPDTNMANKDLPLWWHR